ncbi:MAG TPA: iron-sulfur protein, partial [Lachnospiraceae bacterium]|nr:iron-sulfur protein [Lachnospiraceae bacterium]
YHFRFPDHRDFADMLVDINEYLRPRLYITDAVTGMEGNGPASGTPRKIGALLAGTDPYDLDLLCAHIIGLDPGQVPTIVAAMERGLCPKEMDLSEIAGDPEDFVIRDFQNIRQLWNIEFGGNMPGWLVPLGRMALQARPRAERRTCIGCGRCGQVCPAGAITMVNKYPSIDREKCIRCFCCQEFCPEGAMKVHRPLVARMLNPR